MKLRDNGDGETVSNERLKTVRSREQAFGCLRSACMNRAIGISAQNEQSSRSHFIFTVHVSWKHALSKAKYSGKINLIDLAGSERLLKPQSNYYSYLPLTPESPLQMQDKAARERETLNINQSLSVLGKVFLAL